MTDDPLVPLARLALVRPELRTRLASGALADALAQDDLGEALAWVLLFEHWPELVPVGAEQAFYNRFFWLCRYCALKQRRDGRDAGLEQQLFRLLASAEFAVEWAQVERLERAARG